MIQKLLKRTNSLSVSSNVLIGFLLGSFLGFMFRFFPESAFFKAFHPNHFKFLGSLFIQLIRMIIAPLVFSSVVSAVLSMTDGKQARKLVLLSISVFLIMTLISVALGITAVYTFKPGVNIDFDKHSIMQGSDVSMFQNNAKISSFGDFIMSFVPSNIVRALLTDNFLQIIFFGLMFAASVLNLSIKDKVKAGISGFSEIMFDMSNRIIKVAPFAIFALSFWLFGTQDLCLLKSLGMLIFSVYFACLVVIYLVYSLFCIFILRLNPLPFFKKVWQPEFLAFLLSSGSAVLPTSLSVTQKKLGVSERITNFVVPLGATLNMNGGAVYLGSCTVFVSQLFGVDLTFSQLALVVIFSTFGAVGTAPIPGSAIFLLAGILSSVDLPVEAVAIILTVDRFLDMMRTTTNVVGDIFSALIIGKATGEFSKETYYSK